MGDAADRRITLAPRLIEGDSYAHCGRRCRKRRRLFWWAAGTGGGRCRIRGPWRLICAPCKSPAYRWTALTATSSYRQSMSQTGDPQTASPVDVVLLAVKGWQVPETIGTVSALSWALTPSSSRCSTEWKHPNNLPQPSVAGITWPEGSAASSDRRGGTRALPQRDGRCRSSPSANSTAPPQ